MTYGVILLQIVNCKRWEKATMNDIITELYQRYLGWAASMPPHVFSFIVRATLLYGLPTLFCCSAFRQGSRSVMIQCLCVAAGIIVACLVPIKEPDSQAAKASITTFCFVVLPFLPALLPRFLVPEYCWQRRIRLIGYIALLVLFILNSCSFWRYA